MHRRTKRRERPAVVVDWIRFRAEPLPQNAVVTSLVPVTLTPQQCSIEIHMQTCQHHYPNWHIVIVAQPCPAHHSQVLTCPPVTTAPNAMQFCVTQPPANRQPTRKLSTISTTCYCQQQIVTSSSCNNTIQSRQGLNHLLPSIWLHR